MKKKTTKKTLKLNKEQVLLARRYEKAWHKLYYELPRWRQQDVVAEPDGNSANELARRVRIYVDTNEDLKD